MGERTGGVKHIGERYGEGERRCPSTRDVERVLEVGYARARDSDKIRTVIVVLVTTGRRLTECMSIRKENIDLDKCELNVIGKGDKRRVVPLLETTRDMLAWYTEMYPSDSPFLFPGKPKTGYAEIYNVEKTLKRACLRAGVGARSPRTS